MNVGDEGSAVRLATAKAFLAAGNLQRARTEVESLLASDPHDADALATYCDVVAKQGRFDLLEEATRAWLGREPASFQAFSHLMFCLLKTARTVEAAPLLQRFLAVCKDAQDAVLAKAMYDLTCGERSEGWRQLSREFSAEGRDADAYGCASRAARANGDLLGALAQAKLALEAGDHSATHLEYISVLNFRLLRLPTCRQFARMALNADPTLAVSRELLVLTWLVLLPPVFVAHAVNTLRMVLARQRWIVLAALFTPVFLFAGPVVKALYWIIAIPGTWIGIPGFVSVALSVAYFVYTLRMRGTLVQILWPSSHAPVRLGDY